jgi:hypothetical protein
LDRGCAIGLAVLLIAASFLAAPPSHAGPLQISEGIFQVEYLPPDEAVARQTLEILQEGLAEFSHNLPAGDTPIHVKICRTLQEFRGAAGAYGTAQVGGIARSSEGVIIVKGPNLLSPEQNYRGTVRHELIHVLLDRNTNPAYVPRWFNEGVAMVVSRELRWESPMRIARMYAQRRLIPYIGLDFAFAPLGDEATFGDAYAQALSMTRYLWDRLGEDRFWELVHALRTADFDEALRTYTGLAPDGFYTAWRRSLWKVALVTSLVSGFSAFQLMVVLAVFVYLRKRRRGRRILRQWEKEEEEEGQEPPVFHWEDVEEPPYPWEEEDDERRV